MLPQGVYDSFSGLIMSAASLTFQPWYIDYHRTMAAAAGVGQALRRSASIFELAKDFWGVDRKFRDLLIDLEQITLVPDAELAGLVSNLSALHELVDCVLEKAFRHGYGNRTLTGGSIHSIKSRNEQLVDFIERCELSRSPVLEQALHEATTEYERGETVSIDALL